MSSRFDVCVVGSANLDLVARTTRLPRPGETLLGTNYAEHAGGKGLNQAVAAARSGATTAFCGALGDDAAGATLRAVLDADEIDTSGTAVVGSPTGRALITVDDAGENSIVVVPGANALVRDDVDMPSATVVLAQLEIPVAAVESALVRAREDGATTVLNPAPAAPLTAELIAASTVIVPNEHELELIGGAAELLSGGCEAVVVTLGSAGADIVTADRSVRIAAHAVNPVDTTGAGDAFCGALAARLASGDDLDAAVRWASAAGALATTVEGAVPAQPTAEAIAHLLHAGRTSAPGPPA